MADGVGRLQDVRGALPHPELEFRLGFEDADKDRRTFAEAHLCQALAKVFELRNACGWQRAAREGTLALDPIRCDIVELDDERRRRCNEGYQSEEKDEQDPESGHPPQTRKTTQTGKAPQANHHATPAAVTPQFLTLRNHSPPARDNPGCLVLTSNGR